MKKYMIKYLVYVVVGVVLCSALTDASNDFRELMMLFVGGTTLLEVLKFAYPD